MTAVPPPARLAAAAISRRSALNQLSGCHASLGRLQHIASSDVAIESSDITLLSGQLRGVMDAIELSRRRLRVVYQNGGGAFWVQHGRDPARGRRAAQSGHRRRHDGV